MYKLSIFLISSLLGLGVALDDARSARILQYNFDNIGTGPYRFNFESSDGTTREEEGNLINPNTEHEAVVVRGSYSYTGDDGVVYTVRYTADENGFHPEGDHIKVPPFVPWVKHHHDEIHEGQIIRSDYISTPLPTPTVYLPSTPKPPVQIFRQTPNPELYLPSTPKPPLQFVTSTPRPNLISQQQVLQSLINSDVAQNRKLYGAVTSSTPRTLDLSELDPRLQNTILTLLPNANGGNAVNVQEVNSL